MTQGMIGTCMKVCLRSITMHMWPPQNHLLTVLSSSNLKVYVSERLIEYLEV